MDLYTWNPFIRRAIHSVLSGDFCIKERVIFDYELIYVEQGRFRLRYGERDYFCRGGEILLIRPGVPHGFFCMGEQVVQPHIHFDLVYDRFSRQIEISFRPFDRLSEQERRMIREDLLPGSGEEPFAAVSKQKEFLKLLFEIIELYEQGSSFPALLGKAKMLELLSLLLEDQLPKTEEKPSPIQEIRQYLDENFDHPVSLTMLENQFHYSRFYIEKEFKRLTGESVIKYCAARRLNAARQLLADCSVTETAERLGFSSVFVFSRAFKNQWGISPAGYQKQGVGRQP